MATIQPIPQNPISECFVWRDWFKSLQGVISTSSGSGTTIASVSAVNNSSAIILTTAQAQSSIIEITGILTADTQVIMPSVIAQWTIYNGTTGKFKLTIKPATTPGLELQQTFRGIFYFNGKDIVRSNDPVVG